ARGDDTCVANDIFEVRFKPGTGNGTLQVLQRIGNLENQPVDLPASVTQINIDGRGGTDTVLVAALPANITLRATEPEVFTVGNNGSLADIHGNMVLVTNSGGPGTAATFDGALDVEPSFVQLTRNNLVRQTLQLPGVT